MLPPLNRAFDSLCPIEPEIAALTGLAPETRVFCGIHDSNASLLPYLVSRQAPFTVLSTGTWVIVMCVSLSLDQLDPRDDTLANVGVLCRPIACGRFMGGRECAAITGGGGSPDLDAIERVVVLGGDGATLLLRTGRTISETRGAICGDVATRDRTALATLYCALVSDLMLTRMGATGGDLVVEGTFADNLLFCQTLGALRPTRRVFGAEDAAVTARGAAMLAQWPPSYHIAEPGPVDPISITGLDSYRKAWTAAVDMIAR